MVIFKRPVCLVISDIWEDISCILMQFKTKDIDLLDEKNQWNNI